MKKILICVILFSVANSLNAQKIEVVSNTNGDRAIQSTASGVQAWAILGEAYGFNGHGIVGLSSDNEGVGVMGQGYFGVEGSTSAAMGIGVYGSATGGGPGVKGQTIMSGYGVHGKSTNDIGIYGESESSHGVLGESVSGYGVWGISISNIGAYGASTDGWGMRGQSGNSHGVVGRTFGVSSFDFFAENPTAARNYGSASSRRWKQNIRNIPNALDKLNKLRGVYFDWDSEHGGCHSIGFIAEEIGEVLPEIVVYESNGIDAVGMDYSKITPLLVEATNEMNKEYQIVIGRQEKRINDLEKEIEILKQLIHVNSMNLTSQH